jgi:hypothetical protein
VAEEKLAGDTTAVNCGRHLQTLLKNTKKKIGKLYWNNMNTDK